MWALPVAVFGRLSPEHGQLSYLYHQKSAGTLRPHYRLSGIYSMFTAISVAQTKHQADVAEVATSTMAL